MIVLFFLLLTAGFIALIKGADLFVDGSSALAKAFHVPGLIIGLTIVAIGTSMPELAVSTVAAFNGSSEIALSNVVGSNIFNLLGVLGICALIHAVPVESGINRRDIPVMVVTTLFVLFGTCAHTVFSGQFIKTDMSAQLGVIGRVIGLILLIVFIGYICYLIYNAKKHPVKDDGSTDQKPIRNPASQPGHPCPGKTFLPEFLPTSCLWKSVLFIIIGIVLILAGGEGVVYASKEIARSFGMSETLIGVTIVAVGTSLPELVTSIVAARKGEAGMAVGNIVGSNIFNLLFILGVSAFIRPVAVNAASVWDMLILSVVCLISYVFCLTGKTIDRKEGVVMLLLYIADVVFAIFR